MAVTHLAAAHDKYSLAPDLPGKNERPSALDWRVIFTHGYDLVWRKVEGVLVLRRAEKASVQINTEEGMMRSAHVKATTQYACAPLPDLTVLDSVDLRDERLWCASIRL